MVFTSTSPETSVHSKSPWSELETTTEV